MLLVHVKIDLAAVDTVPVVQEVEEAAGAVAVLVVAVATVRFLVSFLIGL